MLYTYMHTYTGFAPLQNIVAPNSAVWVPTCLVENAPIFSEFVSGCRERDGNKKGWLQVQRRVRANKCAQIQTNADRGSRKWVPKRRQMRANTDKHEQTENQRVAFVTLPLAAAQLLAQHPNPIISPNSRQTSLLAIVVAYYRRSSMPNLIGRLGCRTMEVNGGSSALYLALTPCVSRCGKQRACRLPKEGWGSFPLCGGTFARSYSVSMFSPRKKNSFLWDHADVNYYRNSELLWP